MVSLNSPFSLSVIVVCHNHSQSVERCDADLSATLGSFGRAVELIYVDNGSTDDSLFKLRALAQSQTDGLKRCVLNLRRYVPYGNAFMAGLRYSQGDIILTIDPVLSVEPIEITRVLDEIEQGYAVVLGWRHREHLDPWVRWRSQALNWLTSRLLGLALHDYGTPLRAFRREYLPHMRFEASLYPFAPIFAHAAGGRIQELRVIYRPDYYLRPEYSAEGYIASFLGLLAVRYLSRHASQPLLFFGRVAFGLLALALLLIFRSWRRKQAPWEGLLMANLGFYWLGLGLSLETLRYQSPYDPQQDVVAVFETEPSVF